MSGTDHVRTCFVEYLDVLRVLTADLMRLIRTKMAPDGIALGLCGCFIFIPSVSPATFVSLSTGLCSLSLYLHPLSLYVIFTSSKSLDTLSTSLTGKNKG
jgi:hypothetical protein